MTEERNRGEAEPLHAFAIKLAAPERPRSPVVLNLAAHSFLLGDFKK